MIKLRESCVALMLFAASSGIAHAQQAPTVITGPGTYTSIGNSTYGPDGTQTTIGSTTYTSEGTYTSIGNTTYGPNGTTSTTIGNTAYGNDGTTSTTIGDTTYTTGPDGQQLSCTDIGSTTYCN